MRHLVGFKAESLPDVAPDTSPDKINLKQRLKMLDRQRLAALPDDEMVAVINQRRYFADLKAEDEWKKKHQPQRKKLRFKRSR